MPDFETDDNALFDADMEVESIAEVGENGELPVGKAERKLADYLRTGHDWARMVCGPTKSKWSQYLLQKHGRGIVDDPTDPLQAMAQGLMLWSTCLALIGSLVVRKIPLPRMAPSEPKTSAP